MACMWSREKRRDYITNQAFSHYGIFVEVEREVKTKPASCKFKDTYRG